MTFMPTLEQLKEYAPLLAITISVLALIVSIVNMITGKQTSKIAHKQFQNRLANFELYLIDSFSMEIDKVRFLIFHVTLTNKSESKNSFTPILILEHLDKESRLTKLQLPHSPDKSDKVSKKDFAFFSKQIFLNEKESTSKWLLFSYKIESLDNNIIDSYNIVFKDVNDISRSVKSTIIKDLI